jgi:pilus assembly protein CpaB
MKPGTLLVLLAALFVGGLAAYFAHEIITNAPRVANTPASTIVVAAESLEYGSTLTDRNVIEVSWPSSVVPDGAFNSKAELLKEGQRAVLVSIEKNEPVISSRITGPNQPASLAALVGPGMRAVSITVDEARGVAGFVRTGDRVDVILTRGDSRNEPSSSYADVLLQDVKVLAIGQLSKERQEHATVVKTVTVEVSSEQAQKLVLAGGVGTLSLVLRQAGASKPEAARRIHVGDLGQPPGEVAGPVVSATAPSEGVEVRVYHGDKEPEVYRDVYRDPSNKAQ